MTVATEAGTLKVALPVVPVVVSPSGALLAAFFNLTLAFKILPKDGVTVSVLSVTALVLLASD
ncbi:MAG TPA: hypothetical protein PLT95_05510 [Agitococcus sp.]|nr:hypothetical protein [Agitococcus sp.]HNA21231.1 hypothetical protein [Agitococcus sp.]HNC04332.1 hypothetical protein [Agitococcus sp.]HNC86348.1 hypothetical protein [Agitococcus sp.]HNH44900.1 hypothetical protein [Agitococcus sp.]